jgi:hypothetical protein
MGRFVSETVVEVYRGKMREQAESPPEQLMFF